MEGFSRFTFLSGIYEIAQNKVAGDQIAYITIPYPGCTKDKEDQRCLFCGVQEFGNPNLIIDRTYGDEVFYAFSELVDKHNPTTAVIFNGGNILREKEMWQPTILRDIPDFIREHPVCQTLEIEARVDDIIKMRTSLKMIQESLGEKKLRLRLGIEFFDDNLLDLHKKGITTNQIVEAVGILNEMSIRWIGYTLVGGIDMKSEQVIDSAIKTAKFIIAAGSYKVCFNGMFLTKLLVQHHGFDRVYIPRWEDLIRILEKVCQYRDEKNFRLILKAGFSEEDRGTMLRLPYVDKDRSAKEVMEKLRQFNQSQSFECLLAEE